MGKNYEDWQLERIRNGLRALHKLVPLDGGIKYTWKNLAKAIQAFTGISIPEERLRKFAKGEPRNKTTEKDPENPHYPILSDERLHAVIRFLTHEDSDGYVFTAEDLGIKSIGLSAVLRLAEHLNGSQDFKGMSDTSCLAGLFVADQKTVEVSDLWGETLLRFRDRHHQGLVPFILFKIFQNGKNLQKQSGSNLSLPSEKSGAVHKYEGWAIFTQEECLFLMAQKIDVNENLLYITLGIDKAIYLEEPVKALVLLEIDQPEDTVLINPEHDAESPEVMLENVKNTFSDQLVLFRRNDEFKLDIDI